MIDRAPPLASGSAQHPGNGPPRLDGALYRAVLEALPRQLGRYVRMARFGDDDRVRATDSVTDHEAEIVRIPFGKGDRDARDAHVRLLRERSAVTSPAIRAVLDAGEWGDDDAFAALELLRGEAPLETWATSADAKARARAAAEILAGASLAEERGLSLGPGIVVDDYGQPKILGLERSSPGDPAAATVALVARAAELLPEVRRAALREADASARDAIRAELEREAQGGSAASFASDVARGDAALAAGAGSRHMMLALGLLAAIVLVVVVLLTVFR
jgi:hypothetical protein